MINIYNKATNEFLGHISETDLEFLVDQLEEESLEDQDYYLRKETIAEFQNAGASPQLIAVLQGGIRHDDAIEIRWERDPAK